MSSSPALRSVLVVLLALALNLPGLSSAELESEESRRVLPARAMLDGGSLLVPTVWERPYLAKPPAFYWAVATVAGIENLLGGNVGVRHFEASDSYVYAQRGLAVQHLLDALPPVDRQEFLKRVEHPDPVTMLDVGRMAAQRRAALHELNGLLPGREPAYLPPIAPVTPFAARLTALLASALTGVVLVFVGRRFAPDAGFVAACLLLTAPAVLAKSTLGEIETLFMALTFSGTALTWFALERRSTLGCVLGGLVLALASLTKGPLAAGFALPPLLLWAFTRGDRRSALLRTCLTLVIALGAPVLWYLALVGETHDGDSILQLWRAEAGRGGTGGVAQFLVDRWRLVSGVVGGWLPASVVLIAAWRSPTTRAWRDLPLARFGTITLGLGLLLLACWPGVRARYALPLAPWCALLAGGLLVAATRSGESLSWRPFAEKAARVLGLFLSGLAPLVALVLSIAWFVGPDFIVPGRALNIGHVVFAWILAGFARLVMGERENLRSGTWLLAALILALGLRYLERSAIEAGKYDQEERAAGALWLHAAIQQAGGGPVSIDTWNRFNLLTYTGDRFRWTDAPDGLPQGTLLVTDHERGTARAKREEWRIVFPPPDGLGREAWRRIDDLRGLALLQRL